MATAVLVVLPRLLETPRVHALIVSSAAQALGRQVKLRAVSLRLLPLPSVELRGLEIAEDPRFGSAPFLTLDRGRLRLRVAPLLAGRIEFGELVLKRPLISLVQSADGHWNVASLRGGRETAPPSRPASGSTEPRASAAAASVAGSRVRVEDGAVRFVSQRAGVSPTYRLEQVDLSLTGSPAAIALSGTAVLRPGAVTLKLSDASVQPAGPRGLHDSALRARVAVESEDIGPLLAEILGPAPRFTGALRGVLTVSGTVAAPAAAGELTMPRLTVTRENPQCAPPRARTLVVDDVSTRAVFTESRLTGEPITATVGGGHVTGKLTAIADGGLGVTLDDLRVTGLPLDRVLVDFLCEGYAVTGRLDLTGGLAFRIADPWASLAGDGRLAIGRGKVVGPRALDLIGDVTRAGGVLASAITGDVAGLRPGSPLDFDSITGTYLIAAGIVTTRDLVYTGRSLKVSASGDYALATGKMHADVLASHPQGHMRARLTGTTASPSLRLSMPTALRDSEPRRVERALEDLLRRFR